MDNSLILQGNKNRLIPFLNYEILLFIGPDGLFFGS